MPPRNVFDAEKYGKLLKAFEEIGRPVFARAAAIARCDQRTAKRAWIEGWPENKPPLPPIKDNPAFSGERSIYEEALNEKADAASRQSPTEKGSYHGGTTKEKLDNRFQKTTVSTTPVPTIQEPAPAASTPEPAPPAEVKTGDQPTPAAPVVKRSQRTLETVLTDAEERVLQLYERQSNVLMSGLTNMQGLEVLMNDVLIMLKRDAMPVFQRLVRDYATSDKISPKAYMDMLQAVAQIREANTRAAKLTIEMGRLLHGQATAIHEQRHVNKDGQGKPKTSDDTDKSERVGALLKQLQGLSQPSTSNYNNGERVIDVQPEPAGQPVAKAEAEALNPA